MTKLLNHSLKLFIFYAGTVLLVSIPVYYFIILRLWKYELDEHKIELTPAAGREDAYLIIGAVTGLTAIFFVLLLVGFIILNRHISRKLWQPFYHSLDKIRTFRLDQENRLTFEAPRISEFAELNQSLDRLISANINVYNQQKEFAENASHELQTPLAIIQSKLDLLMQSIDLKSDQYEIIEDAMKALSRVSRINKNLLLLTKIENSQYMEMESVNFSSLLATNIKLFVNFLENKSIRLTEEITCDVVVEGNRILIEILVNNLITNAIRYSPENGTMSIVLSPRELKIINVGQTSLNRDRIFERFGTGSSTSPGTGLGLALVKQVSQRYGWDCQYVFENGNHVFSIEFSNPI